MYIRYDHRADGPISSEKLALIATAVFIFKGIPVRLYNQVVFTPLVPFGILYYKSICGIMITASHNPQKDNGYKLYASNGSQIIPPVDSDISSLIVKNLKPWTTYEWKKIRENSLCIECTDETIDPYIATIKDKLCYRFEANSVDPYPIVYTAMHGVGTKFMLKALASFNIPSPLLVTEQVDPDPAFPTVKYPNPEEGESALHLSIEFADKHNIPFIMANDPDADRIGIAEKIDKKWKIYHGNDIGILFADWMLNQWRKNNPNGDISKVAMVNSTVSSKMIKAMAEKEGFRYEETLTGFKWLGNKTIELRNNGYTILLSYEEAIGYSLSDVDPDKDGISAAAVMAEMYNEYRHNGETINDHLISLYEKYGYYVYNNSYVFNYNPEMTVKCFDNIRNNGKYLFKMGDYIVKNIRDLTTGFDSSTADHKPLLPVSSSTQMITFELTNGCIITLRTSGTEPKIKYYIDCYDISAEKAKEESDKISKALVDTVLCPEQYGFKLRET